MKIWKKITLMFSAIILTTVIALGVYVASAYNFSTNELSKTFKDFKLAKSKSHAIEETKPFSILLMGWTQVQSIENLSGQEIAIL